MKVYLVCELKCNEHKPQFCFFETAKEAHKYVRNLIFSDLQKEKDFFPSETKIEYSYHNINLLNNLLIHIVYSYETGSDIYTIHEIDIEDENYICFNYQTYEDEDFNVEEIGTLKKCQEKMKSLATISALLYKVDRDSSDVYYITDTDSYVDIGSGYNMCNIIQFKLCELMKGLYKPISACLPIDSKSYNIEYVEAEEVLIAVVKMNKDELFEQLCDFNGIACNIAEYKNENVYEKPVCKNTIQLYGEKCIC